MITMIAAVAENGAIGFENKLLYWLPDDMKRFRQLTTGHTIVMGRRTFESLPKGALPNRRNIVLSRGARPTAPAAPGETLARNVYTEKGAELYASLDEALAACAADEEVFVIGGASVYAQALPLAQRLCLTIVHDTPAQADAFFPWLLPSEWAVINEERHDADERHAFSYSFVDLERRATPPPAPDACL